MPNVREVYRRPAKAQVKGTIFDERTRGDGQNDDSLDPHQSIRFQGEILSRGINNNSREKDQMKRMYILGLFFGMLMLFSYQPAVQAMPAFGPSIANVDGVVVKAYTYRRARVTTRRTARRVYRRHTYGYPY